MAERELYAMLGEFDDEEALVAACNTAKSSGARLDAFTPHPVSGLKEALGLSDRPIPLCALVGALAGGGGAYALQYYLSVVNYPLNVGGRPFHSWPAFLPVTFEMTVLFSALAIIAAFLISCRLPQPNHPLFSVPEFTLAEEKYFLLVENESEPAAARALLEQTGAKRIYDVFK